MKRVAVLSWPTGGDVQMVADKIIKQFASYSADIKVDELDFIAVNENKLRPYDILIVGGSTIGADNWLKADNTTKWAVFFDIIRFTDFTGKKAALFALGNQVAFPENFADGMSELKTVLEEKGVKIIGFWPTDGYEFSDSRSVEGENFIGLVIDHETQTELTDGRIRGWVDQLAMEIGS